MLSAMNTYDLTVVSGRVTVWAVVVDVACWCAWSLLGAHGLFTASPHLPGEVEKKIVCFFSECSFKRVRRTKGRNNYNNNCLCARERKKHFRISTKWRSLRPMGTRHYGSREARVRLLPTRSHEARLVTFQKKILGAAETAKD